jgi:hypothetical protein
VKWLLLLVQRHNRSTEWMRNWVEDNADVTSELSVVKKSVFFLKAIVTLSFIFRSSSVEPRFSPIQILYGRTKKY